MVQWLDKALAEQEDPVQYQFFPSFFPSLGIRWLDITRLDDLSDLEIPILGKKKSLFEPLIKHQVLEFKKIHCWGETSILFLCFMFRRVWRREVKA